MYTVTVSPFRGASRLMRFPIDAQLPPALRGWFEERGFEAEHVSERLGCQTPDAEIAACAGAERLVLVHQG